LNQQKIDFITSETDILTNVLNKWLERIEVREANVKEATITIMGENTKSLLCVKSSKHWFKRYHEMQYYQKGEPLVHSIMNNLSVLTPVNINSWKAIDLMGIMTVVDRLEIIAADHKNYKDMGGVSLAYYDPIRKNKVVFSLVIDKTGNTSIEKISTLYKSIKELYLELLPYYHASFTTRSFDTIEQSKQLLKDVNNHSNIFKDLYSQKDLLKRTGTVYFI